MNKLSQVRTKWIFYSLIVIMFALFVSFSSSYLDNSQPYPFIITEHTEYGLFENYVYLTFTDNLDKDQYITNITLTFADSDKTQTIVITDFLLNQSYQSPIYGYVNISLGKYKSSEEVTWQTTILNNETSTLEYYNHSKTVYIADDGTNMSCDFVLADKSCLQTIYNVTGYETKYDFLPTPNTKEKITQTGLKIEQKVEGSVPLPKGGTAQIKIPMKHIIFYNNGVAPWENKYDVSACSQYNCSFLDPTWWNTSYYARQLINCSSITSGTPIVINGTGGFQVPGSTSEQVVWTRCQPNLYLYYNSNLSGAYTVANDTGVVPFEVEMGDVVSTNDYSTIWTEYKHVYHGQEVSDFLIDSTNTMNMTPISSNPTMADGASVCLVGYCQLFDGNDCYINATGLDYTSTFNRTIIHYVKSTSSSSGYRTSFDVGSFTGGSSDPDSRAGVHHTSYATMDYILDGAVEAQLAAIKKDTLGHILFTPVTIAGTATTMQTSGANISMTYLDYGSTLGRSSTHHDSTTYQLRQTFGCAAYDLGWPWLGYMDEIRIYSGNMSTVGKLDILNNFALTDGYGNLEPTEAIIPYVGEASGVGSIKLVALSDNIVSALYYSDTMHLKTYYTNGTIINDFMVYDFNVSIRDMNMVALNDTSVFIAVALTADFNYTIVDYMGNVAVPWSKSVSVTKVFQYLSMTALDSSNVVIGIGESTDDTDKFIIYGSDGINKTGYITPDTSAYTANSPKVAALTNSLFVNSYGDEVASQSHINGTVYLSNGSLYSSRWGIKGPIYVATSVLDRRNTFDVVRINDTAFAVFTNNDTTSFLEIWDINKNKLQSAINPVPMTMTNPNFLGIDLFVLENGNIGATYVRENNSLTKLMIWNKTDLSVITSETNISGTTNSLRVSSATGYEATTDLGLCDNNIAVLYGGIGSSIYLKFLTSSGELWNGTCAPTGPTDSCTYGGSGDWAIDMSDYCILSAPETVTGDLTFTGTGNCTCAAAISAYNMDDPGASSILWVNSGCLLTLNGP